MFCDQCGEKINGDENHKCKQAETQEVKPKKAKSKKDKPKTVTVKKRSVIAGFIISILLITVIAGGAGLIFVKTNTVTAFAKQVDDFKIVVEENDLGDEEGYYTDLLTKCERAIQDKDTKNIKYITRELKGGFIGIEDLVKQNEQKVVDLKKELDNLDTSGFYAAEVNAMDGFKEEAQSFLEENKYTEAMGVLNQWESYKKGIDNSTQNVININQVDVTNYPTVKLYLRMQNTATEEFYTDLTLEGFYLSEKLDGEPSYTKKAVTKAIQINETENLNVNLVADVSGSMAGYPLMHAQEVMQSFLGSVQFQVGDKVSLISFADDVYSEVPFSSDYAAISNAISNLRTRNLTSLYDALYVAVNQTAMESGAKCIIAFTDGMDNNSECTPEIITELATRYSIPIYIIGVGGHLSGGAMEQIANSTGGFYRSINNIDSMAEIYNDIYRQQKEVYLVEYETSQSKDELSLREVYINYMSDTVAARSEYQFTPATLMETTTSYSQLFINDFIIYDSDSRYLTVADLRMLNEEQLRLARNEIYARRGRYFRDDSLQAYFYNLSWYSPSISPDDFSDMIFNDYERANAYFIRDYENLHGFN